MDLLKDKFKKNLNTSLNHFVNMFNAGNGPMHTVLLQLKILLIIIAY